MAFSFKNILIPVDLTINTEVAVNKALEIAEANAVIHLLYVQTHAMTGIGGVLHKYLVEKDYSSRQAGVGGNLEQWKNTIEESRPGIIVNTWIILSGSVQKAIESNAIKFGVDLIIIGKNSHHSWFPFLNTVVPSKIGRNTGIAVLTAKPGSIHYKIKTMIIPVSSENADHKMEVIAAFCRKYKVKIHLVTFMSLKSGPSDLYASELLRVYQWLKANRFYVEYAVLHGENRARLVLNYAEKVNADILMLQPELETKIGWPGRYISDILPLRSRMQVLAV